MRPNLKLANRHKNNNEKEKQLSRQRGQQQQQQQQQWWMGTEIGIENGNENGSGFAIGFAAVQFGSVGLVSSCLVSGYEVWYVVVFVGVVVVFMGGAGGGVSLAWRQLNARPQKTKATATDARRTISPTQALFRHVSRFRGPKDNNNNE